MVITAARLVVIEGQGIPAVITRVPVTVAGPIAVIDDAIRRHRAVGVCLIPDRLPVWIAIVAGHQQ